MNVRASQRLKRLIVFVAILFAITVVGGRTATAQTVYNWSFVSFDGLNGTASGTFVVNDGIIVDITGTMIGTGSGLPSTNIISLRAVSGSSSYDNLFPLTNGGVGFTTETGGNWTFSTFGESWFAMNGPGRVEVIGDATFTSAAVPEINANSLTKALLFLACLLVIWGLKNNREWCSPHSRAQAAA